MENERRETSPPGAKSSLSAKILEVIRAHPVLFIVLANVLFSLGIWNCWVGFGEDTGPIRTALVNAPHLTLSRNLFVDVYTLIFAWITADPLVAFNVMRFLVSVLTSVGLFLVLSRFAPAIKIEAALVASLIWIASRLNAPPHLYTNTSTFTFGIMLPGIYFLFSKRRILGLAGFLLFSLAAISLRPEWLAPFLSISVFLVGEAVWKTLKNTRAQDRRVQVRRGATAVAVVLVVAAMLPFLISKSRSAIKFGDDYLLAGLGQCYANFYKLEHPEEAFDPMTEYQWILDTTFGHPQSFVQAIYNNPSESLRYFRSNSATNLRRIPEELLSTRSGRTTSLLSRPHSLLLYGLLFGGALCAALRLRPRNETAAATSPEVRYEIWRKVIILLLLCSASSVAIVLLVGSPRYWISIVPIVYLGIAWCCDAVLRAVRLAWFDLLIVVASLVFFCGPNFLGEQGKNSEIETLRRIEPLVHHHPVVVALWADPFVVYAFRGEATGISSYDHINSEDLVAGRYDILIINRGFRASKTWADQHAFFEQFEVDPARYGFQKCEYGEKQVRPNAIYYRAVAAIRQ